ncbi:MAG: hypothetical protein JZU53_13430 [Paludibacter sp.]|nr:hypothetical protein [Paludibacter sp.]
MRKKKDLPLSILKSLEPFVDLKGEKFEVVDPKDNLLKVIDKDPNSAFHFTIEKYQKSNNDPFIFLVKRTPKSIDEIGTDQNWFEASAINGQFNDWLILLNEYDTVKSFFDDPIIKSFQEEFYTEFELIDVDVDRSPFKTSQILMLDSYLEAVDNRLNEFITENNSCEIADIKADINLLRNNLTSKSKKWVVKELTTIWAKIAKQGTIFIREFLTESKKEIIKQGVKGILEFVIENGANLLN